METDELEKDAQVQQSELAPGAAGVWTVDIGRTESLQPRDKSRWVWTPVECVQDTENAPYVEGMQEWVTLGLEQEVQEDSSDGE